MASMVFELGGNGGGTASGTCALSISGSTISDTETNYVVKSGNAAVLHLVFTSSGTYYAPGGTLIGQLPSGFYPVVEQKVLNEYLSGSTSCERKAAVIVDTDGSIYWTGSLNTSATEVKFYGCYICE